jgi:hypothetical protein
MGSAAEDIFAGLIEAPVTWHRDKPDKLPATEFQRQQAFVNWMARHAPHVDVLAIPNANRGTDWERMQRRREGARAGALDLVITWAGGVCFAEFKSGTGQPDPNQRERLDRYTRLGHHCGLFRTGESLVAYLRSVGCPLREWAK